MRWIAAAAGLCWMLMSCAPATVFRKRLASSETRFRDHIGFLLFDPVSRKTLVEFNADKYFTPASNTKIFTFYTALQVLGDSVPALRYSVSGDSLVFWGSGDPSFLYEQVFNNNRVYDFLKEAPQRLFFSAANFQSEHLGPGWAWDDYNYTYSSERSPFPVYGNYFKIERLPGDQFITTPLWFGHDVVRGDSASGVSKVVRDLDSNQIRFFPGKKPSSRRTWRLPFHANPEVLVALLKDTLKREVDIVHRRLPHEALTLNSVPVDSLYRVMMQESDNFIAEQLLLVCGGVLCDTLSPEPAIRFAKKNLLFDLADEPTWVDGSGLSRYNLFTPRAIVRTWDKIYTKVPQDRLFRLLAAGGQSGTLKDWYVADKPFIFGKTGSLSNNHTLSGYLITRKGAILIFSFMNANFTAPSNEIRVMMQDVLLAIRNKY